MEACVGKKHVLYLRSKLCLPILKRTERREATSLVWQELERNGLVPEPDSATHVPVKEITLVFDNCGGQNKNRMMFRLLAFTVHRKVCKIARAAFFVRGHTKNDCDRMFNLLKLDYRALNIYTPDDLYAVLNQRDDIEVVKPKGFYNWDGVQDACLKRPTGVNQHHIFTVDSVRDPTLNNLYCQEGSGEEEVIKKLHLDDKDFEKRSTSKKRKLTSLFYWL